MHSAFVTKYYLSLFLKLKFITFVKKIKVIFRFLSGKNSFPKIRVSWKNASIFVESKDKINSQFVLPRTLFTILSGSNPFWSRTLILMLLRFYVPYGFSILSQKRFEQNREIVVRYKTRPQKDSGPIVHYYGTKIAFTYS